MRAICREESQRAKSTYVNRQFIALVLKALEVYQAPGIFRRECDPHLIIPLVVMG